MNLSTIDFTIIAGYLLFIISIGIYFGRKEESLSDYFLGGRRVPWIAVLLSIVATETSALTFIGTPAFAYNQNWTYVQLLIGTILARFIIAKLFIEQFYRHNVFTAYEYLAKRFGTGSKNSASFIFLVTRVLASGVRLFGASIIVSVATGLSPFTAITIIAIAAVLYTVVGGIKAVIWTDVCQAIILFGGGLIALFYILQDIPNGWAGVLATTDGLAKWKFLDFSFDYRAAYTIWAGIIGSTFLTLATHGTDQDFVQRMLTARDYKRSRRALILSGFADIPIVIIFLSIGSLLFAYYQATPTPGLPDKADDIFPYYIIHNLPKGLIGLLIAGVFAAAMSSIDSALNALSTTWINDFYRPYIAKDASEHHYLTMAKFFTVLFGLFLIIIAFFARDTQQVLILGLKIGTFTYGALLGVFLLGVLTRRGNDLGNTISMGASILTILFIEFYTDVAWIWYVLIGTFVTFFVGYLFPAKQLISSPPLRLWGKKNRGGNELVTVDSAMLKEKVGQRLMIGITGTHLDRETEEHLKGINPGSVILFKRNISSAHQTAELISHIKDLLPSPPLIAIDQEGGRVIRFTSDITVFPGNMALGATGSTDLAYKQGLASASQLKEIGIDINLAPVVDVITTYHNPGITIRSFGDNPYKVADFAVAFIEGTQTIGVAAVAKHFPGKGAAEVDAHFDLPTISIPKDLFDELHLYPFRQAIKNGVQGIMTTHVNCPSLDSEGAHPATFSPPIVKDLIRTRYRFDGVIFSDDLEMGAIAKHYPIVDACRRATVAGHDMLLICSNYQLQRQAFNGLIEDYSSSLLPRDELDESVRRLHTMRKFTSEKSSPAHTRSPSTPEDLAQQIAQEAITTISDTRNLIPLTGQATKKVHLLIPDLSDIPALEEGYAPTEDHLLIRECQQCFGGTLTFNFFPLNPSHKEIEQMIQPAGQQDTCILFISNAQENPGQKNLIKKVRQCYDKPLFVFLDNPFDCEYSNPQDTCLTSYGLRRRQILSLIKIIFGKAQAQGRLPFRIKDA